MNGRPIFRIILSCESLEFHRLAGFTPINYMIRRSVGLVNSIYGFKIGDL